MAEKYFPKSNLPIRRSVELLPVIFQTDANDKFLSGVLDPLVQPGVLDKVVGYIGRRYGKTYSGKDVYVDTDATLRSRYQLEPGVTYKNQEKIENFYDYLDFKNQLKFFGNNDDRDDKVTSQTHYTWNPPIDWDKFINYREYYWEPNGPPSTKVFGQTTKINSTYKVVLGSTKNTFVFTPDSYTNNPTVTLYRGQTYKFRINAPGEGFAIRTNYDTGSLLFKPSYGYRAGSLAVYDNKLWRAKQDINPLDGSSITLDSQDWTYVEPASSGAALEYKKGITNNGIENGTLTFEVPYDAPDVLFYQGLITPDCFGKFIISDIEANTYVDVDKEIVGKTTYTSGNGVEFTNGLVVEFLGNVSPSKYSQETWLVEGVGRAITLTKFSELIVPVLTADVPEVLFDNEGFDSQPFDDASAYPTYKDYITIARDSRDSNPWSRYNRWFHRSVLETAYASRGEDFPAVETSRARRPIIEFQANLQLYNFGSVAKQTVDYIDSYTTDVFSKIEGSAGYSIDGEFLFQGARILIIADTDSLSNNKIYEVEFITHLGRQQIHLKETADTDSFAGESVLIRRGSVNGGKMFYFNGTSWIESQAKTSVNQPPLFDVFDENGVSFSDATTYPTSTFVGSKLLSYKQGNGRVDTELGFKLSYLNINNVGDIQFDWNWEIESFSYVIDRVSYTTKISQGFYLLNPNSEYKNGWIDLSTDYLQPIIDSQVVSESTNVLTFDTVLWDDLIDEPTVNFYINGIKYDGTWTRTQNKFSFSSSFAAKDVVSVKVITDLEPYQGFYEIPIGLEKNPFNDALQTFTLGQAIDHVASAVEFDTTFSGVIPGNSNLRNINEYNTHAKRFLKHSGIIPLSIMTLCDKTHNIVKSVQYAEKSYTEFKNNFLSRALEIDYNDSIVDFVDDIINSLTKTKNSDSPFADSDMIGAGAFTSIIYDVEDTGIKTFSLSEKFDLQTLSRKAVYVYKNNQQLLNSKQYQFDSTFGFVRLFVDIAEGDIIEIREYVSSATNHIPPTPTSMGLYKKYTPSKFLDDTYVEPRLVIQGHDGSITAAYGDFRDDLLLELEFRIYNNIKQEYDPAVFDIDSIIGGYYGHGLYKKSQLDDIVVQEFLKWIQNTNINYTNNEYFDSQNPFTYTYSNMTDPTRKVNLPGYWRGVYQWFYDTDRPHRCPWEMLGFSEKPEWWESVYGPAPYTSNNLILWEDLEAGYIRQGNRSGRHDRYKRPGLLNHIPVDGDGKLLDPLSSGLAQDFSLINNRGPFSLGDVSPAEYGWRSSSEWPFAVVMAMCLMKPFEYITDNFDKSNTKLNRLGQYIRKDSGSFARIEDIVNQASTKLTVGLVKYIVSYIRSRGLSTDTLWNKITNLGVSLSYRMSGFVDQDQQKFLLDSKSPASTTSSIYVPPENYDIIFNVSSPILGVSYSGVILEKTEGGWIVTGYDDIHPYFNYHAPLQSNRDPVISVGGISENFTDWTENKNYNNGILVRYQGNFYRAIKTHNSGTAFNSTDWKKLGDIPKIGAVEALRRRTFNTLAVKRVSYGTKLTSIQQVVDLLLGYENYLKSQGFTFDRYDAENQISQDWLGAAKEFMFWTKHNWEIGSLIALSPAAEKVDITVPVGVSDNILDGFYDYQILKGDGKPLQPRFINVNRSFQNVTVETTNTTDGIYYLRLYYVLKEHVTIFDDRTVFNDIIYDKTTGYRQGRIKVQGFRTVDWDGDYTSPGFLFDNVDIKSWQPWTDYKLGDIVAYKSYNWTSLSNQLGTETFDETYWTKLDTTPTKQLVANFDFKIKQFSDYFEVASEGINQSQRDLARHAIGYQQRDYLQNLAQDPVSQFQLYRGFVREKGTANSITKIFGKLSRSGSDSIMLNEEWAFLLGKMGGVDQLTEVEIQLEKNKFTLNPQLFLIKNSENKQAVDQNYQLTATDFTISLIPYSTDINPVSVEQQLTQTAGYVSKDQYEHVLATKANLTSLDITTVFENDHIWITFEKDSWTVLRINESPLLYVVGVVRPEDTKVTLTLNRPHAIQVNDFIGIRELTNLTGFFKVIEITSRTISVEIPADNEDPSIDSSTIINLQLLTDCRYSTYENLDQKSAALLKNKSRLFIDANGNDAWEVVEKNKQYLPKLIDNYSVSSPIGIGTKVLYDNNFKHSFVSIPGSGIVNIYVESDTGLILKQIISPPTGFYDIALGSFGNKMTVSPDGRLLVISAPEASGVPSGYRGLWGADVAYQENDVVLYEGRLWRAKNSNTVIGDGSTELAVNTDDWELAKIIPVTTSGNNEGFYQQGMVAVYEYTDGRFVQTAALISPRPVDNEKFGSELAIGVSGSQSILAVSAIGAYNGTGRVYLFSYDGTSWSHLENPLYKGVYDPLATYYAGEIVWQASQDPISEGVRGNLWQCLDTSTSDGSTLTVDSNNWLKVSDISTNCSLPTNIAVPDDGSTLEFAITGLLSDMQMAELIKQGDQFGFSLAMSQDTNVLIIGAPYADGQYFANYRGLWRSDVEYVEGEVVKYQSGPMQGYQYYKLGDTSDSTVDSTYRSFNEDPSNSANWQVVGDSTTTASGKIFVYKKTPYGSYELTQMINSGSLSSFTDIDSGLVISTGDEFGFAIDVDSTGDTLIVSSPKSDINFQDQGSVYVLGLDKSTTEYRVKQRLESYEIYANEYFGYGISISPDGSKIAVGARNVKTPYQVNFDILLGTTFDNARTTFYVEQGYTGGVYVFDKKDQVFFLTEKLDADLETDEAFGYSIDCVGSSVLVGSPYYRAPKTHFTGAIVYEGPYTGTARLFKKNNDVSSWNILAQQQSLVDIRKIHSIELYDNVNDIKIQDVDHIDPAKGKILNLAEREIKFKTPYDPAVYTIGTDDVVVDTTVNWLEKNVGKLWWDTSKAKWIYAEQKDEAYRSGNWLQLAEGSSIAVYEWVETALLPSEWAALADTNEGLAEGISGQPLYPNDDVYSVKYFYSAVNGKINDTLYYYWVKSKSVTPVNMPDRTRSAAEVENLISNPIGTGIAFIALIASDKFVTYNFQSVINSDTALLNIQYKNDFKNLNPVHREYQLLTEGVADSLPAQQLENKWIDSLLGYDMSGNRVPDNNLPTKQKYGISYRPRQNMFVDRQTALKQVIGNINSVLQKDAFANVIDFVNLNSVDSIPSDVLNLYDVAVDNEIDLQTVGTIRTKRAVLKSNIVNGELDTIDIVDPGFGYKPKELFNQEIPGIYIGPPITIQGDGVDAEARCHIDGQGRIIAVVVTNRGKKYSRLTATVRYFSVLVRQDSTINNFWSIYSWDDVRRVFFRSQSQAYDTTRYWNYADWWAEGYGPLTRITKEFNSVYEEPTQSVSVGDLIRIKEYAAGGWAVFEKTSTVGATFLDRYTPIGRQDGTIQLSSSLYDTAISGIGFDNTQAFDDTNYDVDSSKELRNIFTAVKENIFIGDYAVEWNKLFFSSMRYILSEQQYVDWLFKTSFVNATHNIGPFEQKVNYKSDNLSSYQDYISEVKPYRTTVREYVSRYETVEKYQSSAADFDLPSTYSSIDGKVVTITADRSELQQYPWKWWTDNNGYSIVSIEVYKQGSQYTTPPKVLIEGDGAGAAAQAYISNGKVSGIVVTDKGSGYTKTPKITLVGGNPSEAVQAKAVAVIGDTKVRTFDISVKFDRVSKLKDFVSYQQSQEFVANGLTSVFYLNYAPTRDKNKISILKNNQLVLSNEYSINLYYSSSDSYSLLRGKVVFVQAPSAGDVISIIYDKNIELLTAVNRIDQFYNPTSGMIGKDLNQLMTGIDFGGVQIQGTTFEVTGGWDALPWFTDNWDSVETSSDYYHVCDGSTGTITLPYIPKAGQEINIYIKRKDSAKSIRIDSENYFENNDSSTGINPNAEMPTFVGDGANAVVVIGEYIETADGDILIFRPIESDGSVTITDDNLLDTKLSGGSLSAISGSYVTATGMTAEEISITGGKFISPEQVPAPEENIPGQVLDSFSLRVYQSPISGSVPLQSKISQANGTTTTYPIGQTVIENNSVFVYVGNVKKEFGVDYQIDLENYNVEFNTAPTQGQLVEILSVGIGGLGILDYQTFVADGTTNLFLTNANYDYTSSIFVTVNGEHVDTGFKNSTDVVDAVGRTLIEFGISPAAGDIVKIVCLQAASDVDSSGLAIVKVNTQTFYFEGSTLSFDLDNFVELGRGSARNSMIVEVNGKVLKGSDTVYAVYDGTNNQFTLGTDPYESAGSILPSNIRVFVNSIEIPFITDYTFDGPTKVLTIYPTKLTVGDIIKIQNSLRAQYSIVGSNLVIGYDVDLQNTDETNNDKIEVTWFSEYPSLDIISDQKSGGRVNYKLSRRPISASYVWVYKNGERLRQEKDYYVSLPRGVVYLNVDSTETDDIKTISFTSDIFTLPSAWEIHKDMLNIYHYQRFSKGEITLAAQLNYYDTTITVNNASSLANPISNRNLPGIIYISGERIEYMNKNGNVLSQLRRGVQGTAIAETYSAGTAVVDIGYEETIPYNETQERSDFYSDGSTLLVGVLDFVPKQGTRSGTWFRSTIPSAYGPCDEIEVFAGGRRLRKDPYDIWIENNGAYSPDADETQEAEFSVDGISANIRLTTALPAGTRITVIRRLGKIWYQRGETTASAGITLIDNDTAVARFIAQKTTSLPE